MAACLELHVWSCGQEQGRRKGARNPGGRHRVVWERGQGPKKVDSGGPDQVHRWDDDEGEGGSVSVQDASGSGRSGRGYHSPRQTHQMRSSLGEGTGDHMLCLRQGHLSCWAELPWIPDSPRIPDSQAAGTRESSSKPPSPPPLLHLHLCSQNTLIPFISYT